MSLLDGNSLFLASPQYRKAGAGGFWKAEFAGTGDRRVQACYFGRWDGGRDGGGSLSRYCGVVSSISGGSRHFLSVVLLKLLRCSHALVRSGLGI